MRSTAVPDISPHDADSKSKSYHLNILPGTIILVAGSRIFDRSAVAKQARMVKAEKHPFPMDTIVFGLFFMVPRAGLDLELRLQQGSN